MLEECLPTSYCSFLLFYFPATKAWCRRCGRPEKGAGPSSDADGQNDFGA